ncbi:hypothetical protein I0C86_33205 [Plantactinospora sp. S1510]|uniref:DUF916 domain-containing protein n=1 Tax=Plantactinospora alkalitolerans TaxID=2789879 RepID=A0ABS0H5N9_9ACTN|nr:hypothetical protein [Plantactinospora alkalitolerans]MBF9133757.1 hypothetical protein [Plantactinospora alkalitolerans]
MTVTPLRRTLTVFATVVLAVPVAPVMAAAEPEAPTVTWTVQPANPSGPDGRRWMELTLEPGQVVTEHLAVRNLGNSGVVFALKAADGYLTDKGRFNMLPSGQASVDGGTWIVVQEKVTVGPNETKVVPFTITVPAGATPGDHPAGIAATIISTGGTVNVESRVGFRVLMRASGTVRSSLAVDDLAVEYAPSWNPFSGGTIRVRYTVVNGGNVRATGTGRLAVSELFGLAGNDATVQVEELLPGGSRTFESRVGGVWALGRLRTTVALTPTPLGGNQAGAQIRPTRGTVTTWALPWAQLALLVLLGVLVLGLRTVVRRRRRRLARLLAQVREEGRAEGRGSVPASGGPSASR